MNDMTKRVVDLEAGARKRFALMRFNVQVNIF